MKKYQIKLILIEIRSKKSLDKVKILLLLQTNQVLYLTNRVIQSGLENKIKRYGTYNKESFQRIQ